MVLDSFVGSLVLTTNTPPVVSIVVSAVPHVRLAERSAPTAYDRHECSRRVPLPHGAYYYVLLVGEAAPNSIKRNEQHQPDLQQESRRPAVGARGVVLLLGD